MHHTLKQKSVPGGQITTPIIVNKIIGCGSERAKLIPAGISNLNLLGRSVKFLKPNELALFDKLYTGKEQSAKQKISNTTDPNRFNTVKDITDASATEEEKAFYLIILIEKLENEILSLQEKKKLFQRSQEEDEDYQFKIDTHITNIFDAALLVKDSIDNELYSEEYLPRARKIIDIYAKWIYTSSFSTKLPVFEKGDDISFPNIALFQQILGKLAPIPIANQIFSFSLLEWQRKMFMKLKDGDNVICCAPTSSGKTMIALGFIYTYLKYRPKSLLVYIAPNNVLAMEISAVLNKYVPNQVSTLLDDRKERKIDERVLVCTPTGAFTFDLISKDLLDNSFLVVDEVHCIGNDNGVKMEYCLRRFSSVQTLILSATMTLNTIEKLKNCIRKNRENITVINESTRFMIPQHFIPKLNEEGVFLASLNPLSSIVYEDLFNANLDIPMTPRDILSLYVKIVKEFGKIIPEYINPIRFFFIHNLIKPSDIQTIGEIDEDHEDHEEEEEETGDIRRLSLDEFAAWQKILIEFLANPPPKIVELHNKNDKDWKKSVESIISAYQMSITDESTLECNLENSYQLIEELKDKHMLQALFFFPNFRKALKYAGFIYSKLASKPASSRAERSDREREIKLEALKKRLQSLEKLKLKKGADVKDIKEQKYQLQEAIANLSSTGSCAQYQHSLAENNIGTEDFNNLVDILKKWNSNLNMSSALAQMTQLGIGVLSGDMPLDLQILMRGLYATNSIGVLFVTEDCAYGINTPTKTVILSDGFNESQRRQMAGRAGRKGITTNAWVIYFRLQNAEEAGQKLTDLKGKKLVLYTDNKFPRQENWITPISNELYPYTLTREQLLPLGQFFMSSRCDFGHAALLSPFILESVIKGTISQTNRHICLILAVIACSPFNTPFENKEGWNYEFPDEVKKIYRENGFGEIVPNYKAYMWLTNSVSDFSEEELEEIVKSSKNWSYLFYLLMQFFSDEDLKLYKQVQDLIILSNIRSSISV